jgi:SAM-dependent methyltransferase
MPLLSFRDPNGFVFRFGDRIARCVLPHSVENLSTFLSSDIARAWFSEGVLCPTTVLSEYETILPADLANSIHEGAAVVEHQPIWFPNYPYEWPPEMLRASGETTIRLAREALKNGFELKDATPYNIMFEGPRPVFIDVLSFERRDPRAVIWPAYAQFVRTFVYPLILSRYCNARLDELLLVHRDGLKPERVARMLGMRRWLPRFVSVVALPALFSPSKKQTNGPIQRKARDAREAEFVFERRLKKSLRMLPAISLSGDASSYLESDCVYAPSEWKKKEAVIAEALERFQPKAVLDIGCNAGYFSMAAAKAGASVVAIDHDPGVVGALWKSASKDGLRILPLVVDIARPPGASGWANSEHASFLDRARGRFDGVLMLAFLHHLVVNERVPLDHIFDLAAQLTRGLLLIEYVDPADPQFRKIARGRDNLHRDLTPSAFEAAARRRFDVAGRCTVTPTRIVYSLQRKGV